MFRVPAHSVFIELGHNNDQGSPPTSILSPKCMVYIARTIQRTGFYLHKATLQRPILTAVSRTSKMSLPDPRRVITAHDTTTGAPIVSDEVLPSPGPGQLARQAFVQTAIPGNPNEGVVGKDEKPDLGFIRRGGVSVAYLGALGRVSATGGLG